MKRCGLRKHPTLADNRTNDTFCSWYHIILSSCDVSQWLCLPAVLHDCIVAASCRLLDTFIMSMILLYWHFTVSLSIIFALLQEMAKTLISQHDQLMLVSVLDCGLAKLFKIYSPVSKMRFYCHEFMFSS
jgi:hypothetical protein